MSLLFFFFNDTATTEIYTLSLHDALPIYADVLMEDGKVQFDRLEKELITLPELESAAHKQGFASLRSEEHTSELQSRLHLVCRLLLEKKKSAIQTQPATQCGGVVEPLGPT